MKACWIDPDNDPNVGKLRAAGAEIVYFDIRQDRLDAAYLDGVAAEGFSVGVYAVDTWSNWTPQAFARFVHERLLEIGSRLNPWVYLDVETHDVAWIFTAFRAWRELRPTRHTDWTLEPMQGGLFPADFVKTFRALSIGIHPQHYAGDMRPFAADRVALDLVSHGFPPWLIQGGYDAAALPLDWSGFAYSQGRLP